jgi:hypothetical protein
MLTRLSGSCFQHHQRLTGYTRRKHVDSSAVLDDPAQTIKPDAASIEGWMYNNHTLSPTAVAGAYAPLFLIVVMEDLVTQRSQGHHKSSINARLNCDEVLLGISEHAFAMCNNQSQQKQQQQQYKQGQHEKLLICNRHKGYG